MDWYRDRLSDRRRYVNPTHADVSASIRPENLSRQRTAQGKSVYNAILSIDGSKNNFLIYNVRIADIMKAPVFEQCVIWQYISMLIYFYCRCFIHLPLAFKGWRSWKLYIQPVVHKRWFDEQLNHYLRFRSYGIRLLPTLRFTTIFPCRARALVLNIVMCFLYYMWQGEEDRRL